MNRYTVRPYTVDFINGDTATRYIVWTPGGHALFTQLGSVHKFKHRSSANRKARQLNEAYGL